MSGTLGGICDTMKLYKRCVVFSNGKAIGSANTMFDVYFLITRNARLQLENKIKMDSLLD